MNTVRIYRLANENFRGPWSSGYMDDLKTNPPTKGWSMAIGIAFSQPLVTSDIYDFQEGKDLCGFTYSQWVKHWESAGKPDYSALAPYLWILDVPKEWVKIGEKQACFRLEA